MLFFNLFLVICVVAANEEYKGHKIYSVEVETQHQQDNLSKLKGESIDFLVRPSYKYGVVGQAMVPPTHFDWFEDQLEDLGIVKNIMVPDVYEHLTEESERKERNKRSVEDIQDDTFDIRRYHRYDEILNYLHTLANTYNTPAARVELIQHGETFEGRPLVYLKISNENTGTPAVEKEIIVVEAGIIAREWITIPAILNIVQNILDNNSYLEEFDWIVIPVVNPDGYEYSHTNLRLWQKSRSTKSNLDHICPGVNINRNFDVDWLNFEASSSPCSHLYGGVEAFSEVETQMVQHIIQQYQSRIKLYLSLQNSGGFITYPWHYERAASGMFKHHHFLGMEMVEAMLEEYSLDVSSTIFDRASGTSSDYARLHQILYTYNIDIAQRNGVLIPEEDIGGIIEDVWRAVAVAATRMDRFPLAN